MLHYPATFLIVAVMSAFLGFGSWAGWAAIMAQALFFIFLGMFFLSFIFNGPDPRNSTHMHQGKKRK
jgi:uncharacterized membrane protein YtjA (UPF0391 family)